MSVHSCFNYVGGKVSFDFSGNFGMRFNLKKKEMVVRNLYFSYQLVEWEKVNWCELGKQWNFQINSIAANIFFFIKLLLRTGKVAFSFISSNCNKSKAKLFFRRDILKSECIEHQNPRTKDNWCGTWPIIDRETMCRDQRIYWLCM